MTDRTKPPKQGAAKADKGPILNGPYSEPDRHYATADDGSLDYEDPRPGRRIFVPQTPQVPVGKSSWTTRPSSASTATSRIRCPSLAGAASRCAW